MKQIVIGFCLQKLVYFVYSKRMKRNFNDMRFNVCVCIYVKDNEKMLS